MAANSSRPRGVNRHRPSHRSIAALTACVLSSFSNGASAPYLTVSSPEPMRQAPPPPIAATVAKTGPAEANPDDDADNAPAPVADAPAPAPAPAPEAKPAAPTGVVTAPKLELVPDPVPANHTKLEDILPFFVPPSAPVSRATYEQK